MSKSIHEEVRDGNLENVKLYIAQGGDVNAVDSMKRTPLIIAAWKGNVEILKTLLLAGADSNMRAMDEFSSLHFAAQGNHVDCVKVLGKKNRSLLNLRISKGQKAALHLCAAKGHFDSVKALVELGCDVLAKTSSQQTAADMATNEEIKAYLLAAQVKRQDILKSTKHDDIEVALEQQQEQEQQRKEVEEDTSNFKRGHDFISKNLDERKGNEDGQKKQRVSQEIKSKAMLSHLYEDDHDS